MRMGGDERRKEKKREIGRKRVEAETPNLNLLRMKLADSALIGSSSFFFFHFFSHYPAATVTTFLFTAWLHCFFLKN